MNYFFLFPKAKQDRTNPAPCSCILQLCTGISSMRAHKLVRKISKTHVKQQKVAILKPHLKVCVYQLTLKIV